MPVLTADGADTEIQYPRESAVWKRCILRTISLWRRAMRTCHEEAQRITKNDPPFCAFSCLFVAIARFAAEDPRCVPCGQIPRLRRRKRRPYTDHSSPSTGFAAIHRRPFSSESNTSIVRLRVRLRAMKMRARARVSGVRATAAERTG